MTTEILDTTIIDGEVLDILPPVAEEIIDSDQLADEEIALQEVWDRVRQVREDDNLIYSYYTRDDETEIAICGAHRRNGYPCLKPPMVNRNRCELHGGKSPRGVAHPRFTTGTYSKDMPSRMAERYNQAMKDEKLLELKGDIALVEARIADLLTRVDTGESGETWRRLDKTYNDMRKASTDHNQAKFVMYLNDVGNLIKKGLHDYAAWDEVFRGVKTKQRLAESEHKRMVALKQTMTAEQAAGMLGFVINTIRKHIYEQVELKSANVLLSAISADISNHLANGKTAGLLGSGK